MDGVSGASMEQFKLKDVYEVSAFLKENGIDDCICEKFEGTSILPAEGSGTCTRAGLFRVRVKLG